MRTKGFQSLIKKFTEVGQYFEQMIELSRKDNLLRRANQPLRKTIKPLRRAIQPLRRKQNKPLRSNDEPLSFVRKQWER